MCLLDRSNNNRSTQFNYINQEGMVMEDNCIECDKALDSKTQLKGGATCKTCNYVRRLERCTRHLGKPLTNAAQIAEVFTWGKEQLAVFMCRDSIKVELAWGTAHTGDMKCVGVFPPGEIGLQRLIERLNEHG